MRNLWATRIRKNERDDLRARARNDNIELQVRLTGTFYCRRSVTEATRNARFPDFKRGAQA